MLPLEIYYSILSLVSDTSTLLNLCLCNKELSVLAMEYLYKSVTLVYPNNRKTAKAKLLTFLHSGNRLHMVQSLEFKGSWYQFWPTTMGQTDVLNPRDILLKLTSLRYLVLGRIPLPCDVYPKEKECNFQLRELRVEHNTKYRDKDQADAFLSFLESQTELEVLDFQMSPVQIAVPLAILPNLRSLTTSWFWGTQLIRGRPVHTLNMESSMQFGPIDFVNLDWITPNWIEEVTLDYRLLLELSADGRISKMFPRLKRLSLLSDVEFISQVRSDYQFSQSS